MQRELSRQYSLKVLFRRGSNGQHFPGDIPSNETDLYILCVSDQAIAEVSEQIPAGKAPVVHVSGATPLTEIAPKHSSRGIWYPLMSFAQGDEPEFTSIPFCLEASDGETLDLLKGLCLSMKAGYYEVDSAQRKVLHLAAVMAQNFSNHLYQLAYEQMQTAGLDFSMMKPLLRQSVERLSSGPPRDLQTGPAVRHDELTIAAHRKMIEDPQVSEIYRLITQSIQKKHE